MLYWVMSEMGMDRMEATWEIPIQTLMLCVLENQRQYNKNGITLQDKEKIDELNEQERRLKDGK